MAQPGTSLPKTSSLRRVLDLPGCATALRSIEERRDWLDHVHIELTQIPAPTFLEAARAEYIERKFRELGLQRVRTDSAGNVLGERPGTDANLVVIAAHMDTVVPAGVPVEVKRTNGRICAPGISDNGAGLTAMLGVAAALDESRISTGASLLFAATVGEEGEGDLCGMRRLFSQRDFCRRVKGVLVLDGASIQRTSIAGLGSRRFRIEVSGPGGHSWSDFGRVNPIHALCDVIAQLKSTPLPSNPRTSLNIGVIHGGSAVNVIPESAWMKIDIRSTDAREVQRLTMAVEAAMHAAVEAENQHGSGSVEAKLFSIGDRPAAELPSDARILEIIREVDQHFKIKGRFEASSTDANIPLSLGIEAITVGGGGAGGDAHTPNEWYDPQGRDLGIKRIFLAALALAGVAENSGS